MAAGNFVNPWLLAYPSLRSAVVAHPYSSSDRRIGSGQRPRPRAARRYRLPDHNPICSRPSGLFWSDMDWSDPTGSMGCGGALLYSYVGDHGGIPPVLQSPVV